MLERDGTRLACLDFGGPAGAPAVLFLHGLAGHAGEWSETAGWLTATHRVLALDGRGHGRSERAPADVSLDARVADVAFAIEQLGLGPVVLVGQSLGGHLAIVVAARHPKLVRGLVVADACPAGHGGAEAAARNAAQVRASLARWPVPFPTREAAVAHFGGPSLFADAWAAGLEQREDGWHPAFELDVMERMLREAVADDRWDEWERIRCPALVVRAGAGMIPVEHAEAMPARLPGTTYVELDGAAHDLHLDRPAAWRAALESFLARLDAPG